ATGWPDASRIALRTTYGRGESGSMSCARSAARRAASTWLFADRSSAWSLSLSERSGCQMVHAQSSVHAIASAAKSGRSERSRNGGRRRGGSPSGGAGGGGGSSDSGSLAVAAVDAVEPPLPGGGGGGVGGGPDVAATATGAGAATGGGGGGGGTGAGPCPLVA